MHKTTNKRKNTKALLHNEQKFSLEENILGVESGIVGHDYFETIVKRAGYSFYNY